MKTLDKLHRSAITALRYNARSVVGDFRPRQRCSRILVVEAGRRVRGAYELESSKREFAFKLDTDLYALAKAKTVAYTLEVSADGEKFNTTRTR